MAKKKDPTKPQRKTAWERALVHEEGEGNTPIAGIRIQVRSHQTFDLDDVADAVAALYKSDVRVSRSAVLHVLRNKHEEIKGDFASLPGFAVKAVEARLAAVLGKQE